MISDAIIFIPGIKGTKLVNTNRVSFDTIWSFMQYNFESIENLELTARTKSSINISKQNRFDENINTIIMNF